MEHFGFSRFRDEQAQFFRDRMLKLKPKFLFTTNISGDELYDIYNAAGVEAGVNSRFRKENELICSNCHAFFRKAAGLVFLESNGAVTSLWDFKSGDPRWDRVRQKLSDAVHSAHINGVFTSKEPSVSCEKNRELISVDADITPEMSDRIKNKLNTTTKVITWNHFFMKFPVEWTRNYATVRSDFATNHDLLERAMNEWNKAALVSVLEMIHQNNLYRGPEHQREIKRLLTMMANYQAWNDSQKEGSLWYWAVNENPSICRFKNTSIGDLITDISVRKSDGTWAEIDLDILEPALRRYEVKVAPENYRRPKALFTEAMLNKAKEKLDADGYMASLPRRFATMTDIDPTQILFADPDIKKKFWGIGESAGMFEALSHRTKIKPLSKEKNAIPISMNDFVKNLLPKARKIDLYYDNKLIRNRMALITAKNADSPTMFKWGNQVCWMYVGSITSSSLKENVKAAGGEVEGDLRFSIQWNDLDDWDKNDLDDHCIFTPFNEEFYREYYRDKVSRSDQRNLGDILYFVHHKMSPRIYYGNKNAIPGGHLDIDIINPKENSPAVENIIFTHKWKMVPGFYKFSVHCFSFRGGRSGVRAELEVDGSVYNFDYRQVFHDNEFVDFVTVKFDGKDFEIVQNYQPSTLGGANEVWGIKANTYLPVNLVANSPNYWGNNSVGAKHLFFIIDGMRSDETLNGFANEFIKDEIVKEHKRVLEALSSQAAVVPSEGDGQLAGIGFNLSQSGQSVVLRVTTDDGVKMVKVTT